MTNRAVPKRKVLVTGAAGRIGTAFCAAAADRYDLRLGVMTNEQLQPGDEQDQIIFNIAHLEECQRACEGIDTVVHLAADASPRAEFYASLLDNNIKGTYNIFRAAKDQGCARVIFASSIHAVDGYPQEMQVQTSMPVRPPDMYGVTKCSARPSVTILQQLKAYPASQFVSEHTRHRGLTVIPRTSI